MAKVRVHAFHMAIGVDLIGSKTSMQQSRNVSMEAVPVGIRMYSASSKRHIVIPYANVKGFELMSDVSDEELDTLRSWFIKENVEKKGPGRPAKND